MRIAAPLRALAQRFMFLGLVALSVGLMVMGKAETPLIDRARTAVTDAFAPVLDGLSRPVGTAVEISDRVSNMINVYSENERLKAENENLIQWRAYAQKVDGENRALRDLSRLAPDPASSFITARVVADAGGSFVRSVLVVAGARDGVAKGQTAVTADGLVGRVGDVGERSARILLLTDLNSQVPVLIASSRERAILAGDNSDRPKLMYLATNAHPQVGDRVVTSGDGGVFPPGLPVGVVTATGDGGVRIRPYVQFHRLDYLRIVDYGLTGTLPVGAPPPAPRRR
jgi:rod shape-determining protein MreC